MAALCICWPFCPGHGFLDTLLSTLAPGPMCLLDAWCLLRTLCLTGVVSMGLVLSL